MRAPASRLPPGRGGALGEKKGGVWCRPALRRRRDEGRAARRPRSATVTTALPRRRGARQRVIRGLSAAASGLLRGTETRDRRSSAAASPALRGRRGKRGRPVCAAGVWGQPSREMEEPRPEDARCQTHRAGLCGLRCSPRTARLVSSRPPLLHINGKEFPALCCESLTGKPSRYTGTAAVLHSDVSSSCEGCTSPSPASPAAPRGNPLR